MLMDQIAEVVKEAGQIIIKAQSQREEHVSKSGHANFVTVYDGQVQAFLIDKFTKILPEARYLGEEAGKDAFREEYRAGYLFVIDPIDGTSNFMKGYFPCAISVGLFKDGKPFISVIFNPSSGQLFTAQKGCGAYVEEPDGTKKQLHASDKPLAENLVSFGTCPYYPYLFEESFRLAKEYLPKCIDLRRSGSSVWDSCLVAMGVTGIFFECILSIWDFAAGALLITEAGGRVTDMYGEELTYDGPSSYLACGAGIAKEDLVYMSEEFK